METLFAIVGQLLLGLVELGVHFLGERLFGKARDYWPRPGTYPLHPLVPAIGFVGLGFGFGALGAGLIPVFLLPTRPAQVINLILVPAAVAALVEVIRRRKEARGLSLSLFDRPEYAGMFAFSALLTRFILLDQA